MPAQLNSQSAGQLTERFHDLRPLLKEIHAQDFEAIARFQSDLVQMANGSNMQPLSWLTMRTHLAQQLTIVSAIKYAPAEDKGLDSLRTDRSP